MYVCVCVCINMIPYKALAALIVFKTLFCGS